MHLGMRMFPVLHNYRNQRFPYQNKFSSSLKPRLSLLPSPPLNHPPFLPLSPSPLPLFLLHMDWLFTPRKLKPTNGIFYFLLPAPTIGFTVSKQYKILPPRHKSEILARESLTIFMEDLKYYILRKVLQLDIFFYRNIFIISRELKSTRTCIACAPDPGL